MFKIDYYIFKYFLASKMAVLTKICLMVIHFFTAYLKRQITSSPSDSHTVLHTLWLRRLVVATTTKPNLGHLAPASEVAGRHTLPF
jgi:hypothetical protein